MINNIDELIMIFELEKDKKDTYKYTFNSLAKIYEKNGEFVVNGGKISGYTSKDLGSIQTNIPIFFPNCKYASISITEDIENFDIENTNFVYYKIPHSIIGILEDNGIKDINEQLIQICKLGMTTEFMWCGPNRPTEYTVNHELCMDTSISFDMNEMLNRGTLNEEELIKLFPELNNKKTALTINTKKNPVMDVNTIIKEIKEKIVAQDHAIESIVANIYANQILLNTNDKDLISSQKASILIEGSTGTGKTAIMNEVANKLKLPIVITSTTEYSSTGYVGSSLTDILVKLLHAANGNLELAQCGIVVLDEFDKLAQDPKDINKLALKTAVQQELLSFIGGAKFDISYKGKDIEFDTTNITFVGMGAFTSIRDKKLEEINKAKNIIGFGNSFEKENSYIITEQDYIDYGLQRELVGRFSLLTSTKSYTVEDYKNIMLNSTTSSLKQFIKFVNVLGVENVIYNDEFINIVANKAYEMNFGARGLQKIISNLKNLLLLNIINSKNDSIELNTEMLDKIEKEKVKSIK